jgi:ABC-type branched-subunit amino acid transport system substrate-binding protein
VVLSACVPDGAWNGPAPGNGGSVQVALLVPSGSGQSQDELFGSRTWKTPRGWRWRSLGREHRPAGLQDRRQPGAGFGLAKQAVDEGAQVILGPFYSEEANAAGVAVANSGVNVLAFSNNAAIAGGNVFVLGQTFDNTARRLANYAVRNGKSKVLIVHDRNVAGEVGKAAIERGVASAGGSVVGVTSYEFSQNGIVQAATGIVSTAKSSGATALFLTADTAGALPLAQPASGRQRNRQGHDQFIGLTRWDIPPATLALPGRAGRLVRDARSRPARTVPRALRGAYGSQPVPVAGLAYDGIAAIGALANRAKGGAPLSKGDLTQSAGFAGVSGIFRLLPNGTNERGPGRGDDPRQPGRGDRRGAAQLRRRRVLSEGSGDRGRLGRG